MVHPRTFAPLNTMEKYRQHELLGQGNSAVYRTIRLADGANVALKRIKGWGALPPALQEAALREVRVLRAVDHPHAIALLDTFSDKTDLCLVMPLVRPGARVFEGGALPLSPAAVARVGCQLLSALAYLHGLAPPLLHRDIKPANLLLQAAPSADLPAPGPLSPAQASALVCSGTLLLGDFGSALAQRRTLATGTVSGTPAYKAREILREDEYTSPADVWACGVTLLELATGHVAGGSSAARKAIMGLGGTEWTLEGALAGAFHDKFSCAEEEAAWGAACAAQRAAWGALGEDLRGAIRGCLALEVEGRATASALLAHKAFEKERRAALVVAAGDKIKALLAAGGSMPGTFGVPAAAGGLALEEILAVLEAGASMDLSVLECACEWAVAAARDSGKEWVRLACAALLGLAGSEAANVRRRAASADFLMATVKALCALQEENGAEVDLSGGVGLVVSAAEALRYGQERARAVTTLETRRLEAEIAARDSKILSLAAEMASKDAKIASLEAAAAAGGAASRGTPNLHQAIGAFREKAAEMFFLACGVDGGAVTYTYSPIHCRDRVGRENWLHLEDFLRVFQSSCACFDGVGNLLVAVRAAELDAGIILRISKECQRDDGTWIYRKEKIAEVTNATRLRLNMAGDIIVTSETYSRRTYTRIALNGEVSEISHDEAWGGGSGESDAKKGCKTS